jgi:hypothetical protein
VNDESAVRCFVALQQLAGLTLKQSWLVSHVIDNSSLYRRLLEAMLSAETIGHGSDGVYLASSGAMKWRKLYEAMACALAVRQVG